MKLSEAILLGDSLKKCDPNVWLSDDGSCGCALGGALLATGIDSSEFFGQTATGKFSDIAEAKAIKDRWPWLTGNALSVISHQYWEVHLGIKTIEQLVECVRIMEPAEEPIQRLETTLSKLELAVRSAEMNSGIERSSDSETSDEMDAAVSQGFRP